MHAVRAILEAVDATRRPSGVGHEGGPVEIARPRRSEGIRPRTVPGPRSLALEEAEVAHPDNPPTGASGALALGECAGDDRCPPVGTPVGDLAPPEVEVV